MDRGTKSEPVLIFGQESQQIKSYSPQFCDPKKFHPDTKFPILKPKYVGDSPSSPKKIIPGKGN